MMRRVIMSIDAIHKYEATAPEECTQLFANSLKFPSFRMFGNITTYERWLFRQELNDIVDYYKNQLRILHYFFTDSTLILKNPLHMFVAKELLAAFPDAKIIFLRRDLEKSITSGASLITAFRKGMSNHVDPSQMGVYYMNKWKELMERFLQTRNNISQERFIDIKYADLTRDPLGTMQHIYTKVGKDVPVKLEEGTREWLQRHRKGKYGKHDYSLEEFGLTRSMIRKSFENYYDYFGDLA